MSDATAPGCSAFDTLRFRLTAARTVPRSTVQVSVEVVALVGADDRDQDGLERRVVGVLERFIAASWTVSSIERSEDNSGYERVLLRAHSRVLPTENHNLAERARRVGIAGIAVQAPAVDYALEPTLLVEQTQALQEELVIAAQQRAGRFSELTGRPWRIGDIRFGMRDDGGDDWSPKRVGRQSATASSEGGLGLAERLMLLADVTLRSETGTA